MKHAKSNQQSWKDSPAGIAAYLEAKKEAQASANNDGFDRGLEFNSLFDTYHVFMLPQRNNRCGHELRCEVVYCMDLSKCQKGHGPA